MQVILFIGGSANVVCGKCGTWNVVRGVSLWEGQGVINSKISVFVRAVRIEPNETTAFGFLSKVVRQLFETMIAYKDPLEYFYVPISWRTFGHKDLIEQFEIFRGAC